MDIKKISSMARNAAKKQKGKEDELAPPTGNKTLSGGEPVKVLIDPISTEQLPSSVVEARSSAAVVTFGRMNPPTIGHQVLVDKVNSLAKSMGAQASVFLSKTQDKKKNPLPYDAKLGLAKKAFGEVIKPLPTGASTFFDIARHFSGKVEELIVVVGSDRVPEMEKKLAAYNGKEYSFKKLTVVSAGERDPDDDSASGMSASKVRAAAIDGDLAAVRRGLPNPIKSEADRIAKMIRLEEGFDESLLEALTVQQRIKRAMVARRIKSRMALGRKRSLKRRANSKVLMKRARKAALQFMRRRLLRGVKYEDLPAATKAQFDKRLDGKKAAIEKLAKRLLPRIIKAEMTRKLGSAFKGINNKPAAQPDPKQVKEAVEFVLSLLEDDKKLRSLASKASSANLSEEAVHLLYLMEAFEESDQAAYQSINTMVCEAKLLPRVQNILRKNGE